MSPFSNRARWLSAGALMLLAQLAHAQYSWIDEHGTRVFSDRAPPPGTPPSRILKTPRPSMAAQPQPSAAAAPAVAAPASTAANKAGTPTLAEREADYRKRAAQRDADDLKATQDAQKKAELAEQCAEVRRSARTLASGVRVTEFDANGQQGYLSDAERARRLAQARASLAACN